MSEENISCPYCGEYIKIVAKKCRFCGEWLTDMKVLVQSSDDKELIETPETLEVMSLNESSGNIPIKN